MHAFPRLTCADCVSSVAGFISGFGYLGAVLQVRALPFIRPSPPQGPIIALTLHFLGRAAVFAVVMLFAVLPIAAIMRARKLDAKHKAGSFKGKGAGSAAPAPAPASALAIADPDAVVPPKPLKPAKLSLE